MTSSESNLTQDLQKMENEISILRTEFFKLSKSTEEQRLEKEASTSRVMIHKQMLEQLSKEKEGYLQSTRQMKDFIEEGQEAVE